MEKKLRTLFFVFLSCCTSYSLAQAPVINGVTPNSTSIGKYEKLELSIDLTATYTNPFDYDEILVSCTFKSPGGTQYEADGFFMQDYTLNTSNGSITPAGSGNFRIRFSPIETGAWEYIVKCSTAAGSDTFSLQTFQCTASARPGFVRKNSTNYLGFDNGDQYIPVGENMCWHNNNVYTDYTNWITKLTNNKGNFIRLWMPDWSLGFEWKNGVNGFGGLRNYKQTSAFYLDWLMDYCREKGVYVMLCLNHHGQVSTAVNAEWADNPYNVANGGPCTNTWDFFTDADARAAMKNRLRYIVARYGYSENIMSWELFNEVEWTDNFNDHRDAITAWHNEMAAYLKMLDVNKHLVTTSYAHDNEDPDTWNLGSIDFTQTHYYVQTPNLETVIAAGLTDYLSKYNKPTLNGEFGLGPSGSNLTALDPSGVHIHNSIWAGAFSGAMGTAMSWWWDNYIDPRQLYSHYKPLSELLYSLELKDDDYRPAPARVTGGGAADLTISPGAGWGAPTAANITVSASGIAPGPTQLGSYLYGNEWNTEHRNPPTFTVNYPVAGQFNVITGSTTGTAPKININLDGNQVLDQNATVNTTYSIAVPAGNHTIKVDNPGTDWIFIAGYVFTNIGSPLNVYVLRSSDKTKAAGWVHNKDYNYQYLLDHGAMPPPPVNGAVLHVPGMENASYEVIFYDCYSGMPEDTVIANAADDTLRIALPSVDRDLAMVARQTSVTGIPDLSYARQVKVFPNPLRNSDLFVQYELTRPSPVQLELSDMKGCRVQVIFSGIQQAGFQSIRYPLSASAHAAGMYLLKMEVGKEYFVQKIILAR